MNSLNKDEKFALMICLMEDLRGDWSCNWKERAEKVKELALELGNEKTAALVDSYFKYIADGSNPDSDGRHFRKDFKLMGGYEGVTTILDNPKSNTISKNLIKAIQEFCNYPEYRLEGIE